MKRGNLAGMLVLATLASLAGGAAGARADHYDYSAWRSLYVGFAAGYSLIDYDVTRVSPLPQQDSSVSLDNVAGTLIVGYRRPVHGHFLLGLEADGTIGDNGGSAAGYRYVADWAASGRLVGGVFLRPHLLLYVTGGVSVLAVNTAPFRYPATALGGGGASTDPRVSQTLTGGIAGAGIEWETGHGFNVRAEYLYSGFESWQARTSSRFHTIDSEMHQARVGVVFSLDNPYDHDHHRGDIDRDRYWRREPMK